jgi:hypothetical protein
VIRNKAAGHLEFLGFWGCQPFLLKKFVLKEAGDLKSKFFAPNYLCLPQGCQMVSFQTKNTNLAKFWRMLQWCCMYMVHCTLVHFLTIWPILRPFGIFCGHLVYFVAI